MTATDFGVSKPTTAAGGGGVAAPAAEEPLLHPSKTLDAITLTSKQIWIFMKLLPAENDFLRRRGTVSSQMNRLNSRRLSAFLNDSNRNCLSFARLRIA
jgi:hypothetical protein